jgi:hypothetical protein
VQLETAAKQSTPTTQAAALVRTSLVRKVPINYEKALNFSTEKEAF